MAWKKDDSGNIVVQDGNPVWIYEDGEDKGKESPFNAASALATIHNVTKESMARKVKIKELETLVEPFKGIENPVEYRQNADKALGVVANLKDGELVEAGKVEQIKRGVAESFETKLAETEKSFKSQLATQEETLQKDAVTIKSLLIKGALATSKFLTKTVLTPRLAVSEFGNRFVIEDVNGEPTAIGTHANGEKIFSLQNPGSYANVDEALEIMVGTHPDKDALLKGTSGGGGASSSSGGGGGSNTMSRKEWDNKNPTEQMAFMKKGGTVVD